MDKRYKYLGSEERGVILAGHRRGSSLREIGLVLGRAPSTIGRELARGGSGEAGYSPQVARAIHDVRRSRCRPRAKLAEGGALHDWVRRKLVHQRGSPEPMAARLRAMQTARHADCAPCRLRAMQTARHASRRSHSPREP